MAPTSRSRRPKVLTSKSAKQYLTVGFAVGIVVLLLLQMTALSRHSIPEHSSPLNLALREQRHHDVSQKNPVQQERTLQRYAESKKKSDRRRLNTTHGNQSRAENASTATVLKEDLPKLPSTGHALQFLNTTFKLQKRNQTHPTDLTKTLGNVTNLIARRQRNATTLQRSPIPTNVTANATAAPTKKHRPFRLQRSVPQAPWEFQNRSMPLDPLSPKFDISTLRPTNYTLKSKWHGVLLDAGRHYFEVDWIMRMLDILAVLQYNCLHFRLTDDQSFNVLLKSQPDLAHPVGLFGNNKTYTPDELKNIVAYAKTKGITVWPEINVPVSIFLIPFVSKWWYPNSLSLLFLLAGPWRWLGWNSRPDRPVPRVHL